MNPDPDFDSMELALSRAAARHAPSPLDPRRVRRRLAVLQAGPWLWLLFVVALAVAAAVDAKWWIAALAGLVLLPGAVSGVRARRDELAALATSDDLASFERLHFAALARRQRSAVVVEFAATLVLAAVAWQLGDSWRWGIAALFGAITAGRMFVVLPWVERANRDAGGEPPPRWATELLLFGLFALLPLWIVVASVRAARNALTRRRGGRA